MNSKKHVQAVKLIVLLFVETYQKLLTTLQFVFEVCIWKLVKKKDKRQETDCERRFDF